AGRGIEDDDIGEGAADIDSERKRRRHEYVLIDPRQSLGGRPSLVKAPRGRQLPARPRARAKKWPGHRMGGRAISKVRVDLGRAARPAGPGVGAAPTGTGIMACAIAP